MSARASWKGFLRIRLVSVPVKAYSATASGSKIQLNQLHRDLPQPDQVPKVLSRSRRGRGESIVSGYHYAKGRYVVIDSEELEKLRRESDKVVEVEGFLPKNAVDPLYLSGKDYFLVPEGPVGQKAYALLREVMSERGQSALAKIVLTSREQIVLLRPLGRLLVMSILSYAQRSRTPRRSRTRSRRGESQPQSSSSPESSSTRPPSTPTSPPATETSTPSGLPSSSRRRWRGERSSPRRRPKSRR